MACPVKPRVHVRSGAPIVKWYTDGKSDAWILGEIRHKWSTYDEECKRLRQSYKGSCYIPTCQAFKEAFIKVYGKSNPALMTELRKWISSKTRKGPLGGS